MGNQKYPKIKSSNEQKDEIHIIQKFNKKTPNKISKSRNSYLNKSNS